MFCIKISYIYINSHLRSEACFEKILVLQSEYSYGAVDDTSLHKKLQLVQISKFAINVVIKNLNMDWRFLGNYGICFMIGDFQQVIALVLMTNT